MLSIWDHLWHGPKAGVWSETIDAQAACLSHFRLHLMISNLVIRYGMEVVLGGS